MTADSINPRHYKGAGGLEVIDVIEAFGLQGDYYLASALKYILRAGKKEPSPKVEDLNKAIWFLERAKTKDLKKRYEPVSVHRYVEAHLAETKQTEDLSEGVEHSGESARVRSTHD